MVGTKKTQCKNPSPNYCQEKIGQRSDRRIKRTLGWQSMKNLTMHLIVGHAMLLKKNVITRTRDIAITPTPTPKKQKMPHGP